MDAREALESVGANATEILVASQNEPTTVFDL